MSPVEVSIETDRLVIKSPHKQLAKPLADYMARNRQFLQPWTPIRSDEFYTEEWHHQDLKKRANSFDSGLEYRFYIHLKAEPHKVIGDIGFSNVIRGYFHSCNLGYQLDKDELQKGYMFEALSASIGHVFQNYALHRLEANIIPRNAASIALVKKLGFKKEGYSEQYLHINNVWEDHERYALINESWQAGS